MKEKNMVTPVNGRPKRMSIAKPNTPASFNKCLYNDIVFPKVNGIVTAHIANQEGNVLYPLSQCIVVPTIQGPKEVKPNYDGESEEPESFSYYITNYDKWTEYEVLGINGEATLDEHGNIYYSPIPGETEYGFIVNRRYIKITVIVEEIVEDPHVVSFTLPEHPTPAYVPNRTVLLSPFVSNRSDSYLERISIAAIQTSRVEDGIYKNSYPDDFIDVYLDPPRLVLNPIFTPDSQTAVNILYSYIGAKGGASNSKYTGRFVVVKDVLPLVIGMSRPSIQTIGYDIRNFIFEVYMTGGYVPDASDTYQFEILRSEDGGTDNGTFLSLLPEEQIETLALRDIGNGYQASAIVNFSNLEPSVYGDDPLNYYVVLHYNTIDNKRITGTTELIYIPAAHIFAKPIISAPYDGQMIVGNFNYNGLDLFAEISYPSIQGVPGKGIYAQGSTFNIEISVNPNFSDIIWNLDNQPLTYGGDRAMMFYHLAADALPLGTYYIRFIYQTDDVWTYDIHVSDITSFSLVHGDA